MSSKDVFVGIQLENVSTLKSYYCFTTCSPKVVTGGEGMQDVLELKTITEVLQNIFTLSSQEEICRKHTYTFTISFK
jgi:hypothetical protein